MTDTTKLADELAHSIMLYRDEETSPQAGVYRMLYLAEQVADHRDVILAALRAASAAGDEQVIGPFTNPEDLIASLHSDSAGSGAAPIDGLADAIEWLTKEEAYREKCAELARVKGERDALVMAVGRKYSGETRYETALRYINEREQGSSEDCRAGDVLAASTPAKGGSHAG